MKLNMKLLGILIAMLLVGGAYWLGSYLTTAQMMPAPAQQTTDPMSRMATALERMAQAIERIGGMGSGRMGLMGGMSGMMGSMAHGQPMGSMMQDMKTMMEEMMQSCQQMMGQNGMASPMREPQPTALTEADLTRTTTGAAITVAATFLNPLLKPEEVNGKLVFKLALDTHSADLMSYDLTKMAVLRNSEGLAVEQGFTWEPQEESSHHRAGLLRVDASVGGKPLITQDTKYIELELKGLGIPSRLFKWEEAFLGQAK